MRLAQANPLLLSLMSDNDLVKLHSAAASATAEMRAKIFIISDVRLHRDGLMSRRLCISASALREP